ncbi:MAG: hypothetical protein GIX03_16250 [Candidatus Eremiobacteraeota bacterium]|nr:hypothetical protein [Candidatus Eremiobacteraeota bacterium]MBC5804515.1 hypothetical protein [Candidatus Eremiobacteraeota bacterium]
MKLLLLLRALATVVAVACTLLCLFGAIAWRGPLRKLAGLAVFAGLGAQLGIVAGNAVSKRAPWTRALIPLFGIGLALETFWNGPHRGWPLVAPFAALDLVIVAVGVVAITRALRRSRNVYAEDILEREFERFATGPLNRFVAVELVTLATAVRYCCGGFRAPLSTGFSYVRGWTAAPLLLAAPLVFILPEMLALDLALASEPWYWRLVSDFLHVYAALWLIGIFATARSRPHQCDADRRRPRNRFATARAVDRAYAFGPQKDHRTRHRRCRRSARFRSRTRRLIPFQESAPELVHFGRSDPLNALVQVAAHRRAYRAHHRVFARIAPLIHVKTRE